MTSYPSPNLGDFTASHHTESASGSRISDSEPVGAIQVQLHSRTEWSESANANSQECISICGIKPKSARSLTECSIHEPFATQTNGSMGQTIVDTNGLSVAWTTDPVIAQMICKMLNDRHLDVTR